ncbi:transposase [Pseudoponticoccus marisrubri]|uniref:transposase n=1 Tax=Pseudoponticoccus marisrubri TaxID=1685382 RepID=UPI000A00392D
MLGKFESLYDLFEAFPDEQSCLDHLRAIRWRDGEFCPHCDGSASITTQTARPSSVVTAGSCSLSRSERFPTTQYYRCASGSWRSG